MPKATVLIPTYNHGPTIEFPIRTVLNQTEQDFELFIVGDGATEDGKETIRRFANEDSRIRFFDRPKGERHGEEHRNEALKKATGETVCYLSDDDLWLPEHLEYLTELLKNSDFAHSLPIYIDENEAVQIHPGSFNVEGYYQYLKGGKNFVPLNCAGHTMKLYKSLPHGWRPGPKNLYSDLHMFQQILEVEGLRSTSGLRPTAIHFPSPDRKSCSTEERVAELARWYEKLSSTSFEKELTEASLRASVESAAVLRLQSSELDSYAKNLENSTAELKKLVEQHKAQASEMETHARENWERSEKFALELKKLDKARLTEQERKIELENQLNQIRASKVWQIRDRCLKVPGIQTLIRTVKN